MLCIKVCSLAPVTLQNQTAELMTAWIWHSTEKIKQRGTTFTSVFFFSKKKKNKKNDHFDQSLVLVMHLC